MLEIKLETHGAGQAFRHEYAHNHGYILYDHQPYQEELKEELIAVLTKDFDKVVDHRPVENNIYFMSDDAIVRWREHSCGVYHKAHQYYADFLQKYSKYFLIPKNTSSRVWYYFVSQGGVSQRDITLYHSKLPKTYPELYPDIDISLLVEAFQKSDDSILILYGDAGVGKTTFVKYLLQTGKYPSVGYIKDQDVLTKGEFWSDIASSDYNLLVLDDLDFALHPRDERGDDPFMSNLLSYSDGIFYNKSKILITTNLPIDQMDSALIRPGRCFDFLTLKPLALAEAKTVWQEVLRESPESFSPLLADKTEITQAEIMTHYRLLKSRIQGRPYMKQDNGADLEDRLKSDGIHVGNGVVSPFGR